MRIWLPLVAALPAVANAAPPAPFASAIRRAGCDSIAWTRIAGETWFATCVTGDEHRGFVLHHAAGAATFDELELFDLQALHARRGTDVDVEAKVAVAGTAVTATTNDVSGATWVRTWDLAVYPPRLVRATYGGGDAWSSATAPTSPTCTVDLARRRDRCTSTRPSCDTAAGADPDSAWEGDEVAFRTVPVVADPTSTAPPPKDPFACAAIYGDDPADVYFGTNPRHTTFEAVADDHVAAPATLTLYLRAHDATPAPAARAGAWQGADHWEIWLAAAGDPTVHWRDDPDGYCAARRTDYVQLIVAPHADGTIELVNGTPKARGSIAGVTAHRGAGGSVVVQLPARLEAWASDGAITVSYSDSLDGKRQSTLVGSSHVVWGKPASLGRLGRDLLCHPGAATSPEVLRWK